MSRAIGVAAFVVVATASALAQDDDPPLRRLPHGEGLTLAGRVVGATKPVAVELWRFEYEDTGDWYHRTQRESQTIAPGGEYRFADLPPGMYACEFPDQHLQFAAPTPNVELFRDVTDRALVAPSGCRLKGRVTRAHPEHGSHVTISLGYFSVDAAADGSYETPDVPPGDYRAQIAEWWSTGDAFHHAEYLNRSIPVHLDGVKTLDFAMTDDTEIAVAIRSSRAEESFEGDWSVRSDVVDLRRRRFLVVGKTADAPPLVRPMENWPPYGYQGWDDPKPRLRRADAPIGRHLLQFEALGFAPWEREVEFRFRAELDVEMTPLPGEYVDPGKLPTVSRIEARPVGGAWRELIACDRRMTAIGAYVPDDRAFLAPGKYEWRAESLESAPTPAASVEIGDARDVVRLVPKFAPGPTLRGRLATKSGAPLGGVRLRFAVKDGDAWRFLPTKDAPTDQKTGAFAVKGLSPGRWRAQLGDDAAVVLGEFDVKGADVSRDFVFAPR